MINPAFIDGMSWRMAEVYGACVDKLLVNIAHYFPYIKDGREPKGTFDYMVRMLAQMGQVTQESINIITNTLGGADPALRNTLINAIGAVIREVDPPLRKAAEAGLLGFTTPPPMMSPNMTQAFQSYYRQSADKLNLVNTVMLESTQQAYSGCVANVVQKINNAQGALNIATGEVVTGASTWNQAMREAVNKMVNNGLTGFIDHGGHHWSPEAYVAMDIRTTVSNAARATVWEQNEAYGNDLYSVSTHDGARPLCYPWQGKVISRTDTVRDVTDLHGDIVHVYAQSETTYGQAAGLFGINCGHFPYPFVPGLSVVRGEPQTEEANDKTYEESQQQRKLERELRYARRDLEIEKARGAPPEVLRKYQDKVDRARDNLDSFCDKTGRNRRRSREYTPINAKFPPPDSYDVTQFDTAQRDAMQQYFANGGVQSGMNPNTVFPTGTVTAPQNVAPQAATKPSMPQQNVVQLQATSDVATKILPQSGIQAVPFTKWDSPPTEAEIIASIGGADKTKGSCASVALAYAGNKAGYNVHDFRGGASMDWFATKANTTMIAQIPGIDGTVIKNAQEIKTANKLLSQMTPGKEYWLGIGRHASIVRATESGYEYMELQSANNNGWHHLDDSVLRWRFGAVGRRSVALNARLIDVEKLGASPDFVEILQYLNTPESDQKKGVGGGIK